MLGIDYGSDSEDDSTAQQHPSGPAKAAPKPGPSRLASNLALPPPNNSMSTSKPSNSKPNGLELPAPKARKATAPKKIFVELPKLEKHDSGDEFDVERPAAKKPRLGGNGRASGLLSLLPAPKKSGLELPATQRVLGGGQSGVVYTAASSSQKVETAVGHERTRGESSATDGSQNQEGGTEDTARSMIPPSMLLKGKGKASSANTQASPVPPNPSVDFFSLGSTSSTRISTAHTIPEPSSPSIATPSVSAAPKVEEFTPPSPKIDDPYPGYFALPSGAWAMHDPTYYKTYSDRWAKEYQAQIRAYEKGLEKGFEGAADEAATTEVNADELADAARKEREEKKALTKSALREGERKMPKIAINPTKTGGLARTRHQLHSLLTEAYMNREALEEKIAQGRRNRKEAGNKYGF